MAKYDDLYQRLEESSDRAQDAAANFNAVLTEDENTDVMVDGKPVPSLSKRIKVHVDEGLGTVAEATEQADRAKREADRAKLEADRTNGVADQAATSASAAAASATAAKNSQTAAKTSETNSKTSENAASSSASAASTSAAAAKTSETNSKASETAASGSASAAAASASAASGSASAAKASETKAKSWADSPKGTPVESGKYSAKHWAETASEVTKDLLSATGGVYRVVAGAIRQEARGQGWVAIIDGDHSPLNVVNVSSTANTIDLDFGFNSDEVISLVCGPDETFANMGIVCGASVGLRVASIQVAAPLNAMVTLEQGVVTVDGPEYLLGKISASVSGDLLKVTHPQVPDAWVAPVVAPLRDFGASSVEIRAGAFTKTGFSVETLEDLNGWVVRDTGDSFTVTDSTGANVTAQWRPEGVVRVSHPSISSIFGPSLTPVGNFVPYLVDCDVGFFDVAWKTPSGDLVTSPDDGCKVRYQLPGKFKTGNVKPSVFSFSRGLVNVSPADLFAEFGNIWFVGVVKKN